MEYVSVKEWAEINGVSERTARNYCAHNKIDGAYLVGKTWNIPADAQPPKHTKKSSVIPLLQALREQKSSKTKGGIYHRIQIDLTYNSNHIEGSILTHDQTRYIFETNTIGITEGTVNVDDIIETKNHFRAIDYIIDNTGGKLTEAFIKRLHYLLKSGTSDERKARFRVGDYKKLPNEVGGNDTVEPENIHTEIKALHPFQDGNGRVGRLIMFRECLRFGYVPFIITDELKMFYYNGLRNWPKIKGYLMDTCLSAQDNFKMLLKKFRIKF